MADSGTGDQCLKTNSALTACVMRPEMLFFASTGLHSQCGDLAFKGSSLACQEL